MNVEAAIITKTSKQSETSSTTFIYNDDSKSFKTEFEEVKNQNALSQTEEMNQGTEDADCVKEQEEMTSISDVNGSNMPLKQSSETMTNNINNNLDLSKNQNFTSDVSSKGTGQSFAQAQQEAQKSLDNSKLAQNDVSANPNQSEVLLAQIQQDGNINSQSIQNTKTNPQGQTGKDKNVKTTASDGKTDKVKDISESLDELSSKIATLNELKTQTSLKTYSLAKSSDIDDKSDSKIKMNNNDITFFVNLTQGINNTNAANSAALNISNITAQSSGVEKTESTAQSMQVSQTLLNALTESMQTNKPFRIDFGSDVAVIMKVDKNGNLSANFIPGSAAVESYLRNNIELLRQNFDNQNLPYNELTYSREQKQDQQQRRNNKENDDE